jgi:hypothetical protein
VAVDRKFGVLRTSGIKSTKAGWEEGLQKPVVWGDCFLVNTDKEPDKARGF